MDSEQSKRWKDADRASLWRPSAHRSLCHCAALTWRHPRYQARRSFYYPRAKPFAVQSRMPHRGFPEAQRVTPVHQSNMGFGDRPKATFQVLKITGRGFAQHSAACRSVARSDGHSTENSCPLYGGLQTSHNARDGRNRFLADWTKG